MIHVINLDRSPERWEEFNRVNGHLQLTRCSAVDGRNADPSTWKNHGLITRDILLTYAPNELACAMSHISLWKRGYSSGELITISEDDAIFHHAFQKMAQDVIDRAPPEWDMIVWGWNFDIWMAMDVFPGGLSTCIAQFEELKTDDQVSRFQKLQSLRPTPVRLRWVFGLPAYTLSPSGAQRLLDKCLPLRPLLLQPPPNVPAGVYKTIGLDLSVDAVLQDLRAYVSFPPIVVTRNIQGQTK